MFNHNLRILSFVPRWQIAPRFRTQNVAEHSFFVALYTQQLLQYKPHWSDARKLEALNCALHHDVAEARTGDMPGPVKRAVVDPMNLVDYEREQLEIMGVDHPLCDSEILDFIKVADLIDELFHVSMEVAMGNTLLRRQIEVTEARFHAAVRRAGLPSDVSHMVDEEVSRMLSGFHLPANSPTTDPLSREFSEEIPF